MLAPLVPSLLGRLDRDGVLACSCGQRHVIAGEVLMEQGALARSAELLVERYGSRPVWVLSDENTEAVAGARWKSATFISRVLPAAPKPVPEVALAEELRAEVERAAPDLLVAVGGGTISDLVKKISLDLGLPNWCIATAPSVDAYSAATSAMRVAGRHQPGPARAPEVIVCDLDILVRAPRLMLLAGLGDLLAKFVAHLDWNLAHLVTGEHHCDVVDQLALGSARMAVQAARALESDPLAATAMLTDAILASGFAMQAMGHSRPAASAEHTIAHYWTEVGAAQHEPHALHGILVGAATALILPGYRAFYGDLPDTLTVERARIASLAGSLLAELSDAVEVLERIGFPFDLDQLGMAEPLRIEPVRQVRSLRARYTTFDLAHDLGREDQMVSAIAAAIRPARRP
ncbi:MAG TPA: iron-containing alcohol dehydrogenase [Kofleriaceae bacterium]|nr:iron-containing alcohol dehydrogenase [Kofleriaceae bacterium]